MHRVMPEQAKIVALRKKDPHRPYLIRVRVVETSLDWSVHSHDHWRR